MAVILFFLVALLVMAVPSHFLSLGLYRRLKKDGNKNALALRIGVFIVTFIVIGAILFFLIINNLRFER